MSTKIVPAGADTDPSYELADATSADGTAYYVPLNAPFLDTVKTDSDLDGKLKDEAA